MQTIATSAHTGCGIPHILASIENNGFQQRSKVRFAVALLCTYAAHRCVLKDQGACRYGVIVAKCHHCDSVLFTSWHWFHQFLSVGAHPLIHSGNYAEVPVKRGSGYASVCAPKIAQAKRPSHFWNVSPNTRCFSAVNTKDLFEKCHSVKEANNGHNFLFKNQIFLSPCDPCHKWR